MDLSDRSFASPTIQQAVADVEREAEVLLPHSHLKLSSGVVLRTKQVPILRLQAVANKIKPPKMEDYSYYDADREETIINPNHPEYLQAMEAYHLQQGMAVMDALIVFGTEIVSVPEGVAPLESDEWLEDLKFVGIEVVEGSKLARYLSWVRYVAAVTEADIALITKKAASASGTSEEMVATAIENFPDNGQ